MGVGVSGGGGTGVAVSIVGTDVKTAVEMITAVSVGAGGSVGGMGMFVGSRVDLIARKTPALRSYGWVEEP